MLLLYKAYYKGVQFFPPSGRNPPTYNPTSTVGRKAFGGHNMAFFKSTLARGTVPPSAPNPPTYNPSISGRAFAGHHFMAHLQESLKKGPVTPSEPNPGTHIR